MKKKLEEIEVILGVDTHLEVNAVAESFFGSLKQERVHWRNYQSRLEAQQDVLNYISMFYNSYRLHSYLDYVSPNQYEAEMAELKKSCLTGL